MHQLTEFQKKCEKKLTEILATNNKSLYNRGLEGVNETYIHARISDTSLEVWI